MAPRLRTFLAELKRRKVYHVGLAYVGVGAILGGAVNDFLPNLGASPLTVTLVLILILVGLPVALILAWAYELRPEEPRPTETTSEESSPLPKPAAATAFPSPEQQRSIVVLPFDNLSPDPSDAYFSDGLTEELITDLSYMKSLRVISRNSAMVLKGTQKDTRTIARELDVQYVLEGSVRKAGNELRITAQLIDAAEDRHLWAERYDGVLESVFSVQETVARSIVEALGLVISPEEDKRLVHRPFDNVPAFQCYLRARQDILLWTVEGMERATRHLENGLEMVGENATLLYGLALVEQERVQAGLKVDQEAEESLHRVAEYAAKILELEPGSPFGHCLLGILHHWSGEFLDAVGHYEKVLETDPANPDVLWWLSILFWATDQIQAAEPLVDRFLQTDPLSPRSHDAAAMIHFSAGRKEAAAEASGRAHDLEPENHQYRLHHVLLLIGSHRLDEAKALAEEVRSESHENVDQWHLSVFAAALGNDREEVSRMVESASYLESDLDEHSCFQVAMAYDLVEETEKVLEWLERGVERGHISPAIFDGLFRKAHRDPRFEALKAKAKSALDDFAAQLESTTA